MAPLIMSAEKLPLAIALKTLWGATEMPFGDACAEPYRHPSFEELTRRLQQLCEIGASGVLHGPNGIGKSYLCGCFTDKLPEKRYKILSLAHSSLTGNRATAYRRDRVAKAAPGVKAYLSAHKRLIGLRDGGLQLTRLDSRRGGADIWTDAGSGFCPCQFGSS